MKSFAFDVIVSLPSQTHRFLALWVCFPPPHFPFSLPLGYVGSGQGRLSLLKGEGEMGKTNDLAEISEEEVGSTVHKLWEDEM